MSEPNLGTDIKLLRIEKGIGSRELSRLVGKAETYISQLERGKIKNPEYDTLYNIFKQLGYQGDIEELLYRAYFIESPERMESDEVLRMQEGENQLNPAYQQLMFERDVERELEERKTFKRNHLSIEQLDLQIEWLAELEQKAKEKNEKVKKELSFFIDKKFDTFSHVIDNLHEMVMSMRKNKENYDFFTDLFKHDLTKFNEESKKRIIETIKEEYKKSHNYNGGWGDPPSF